MKIIVNHRYGGFGINQGALHELRHRGVQWALDEIDVGEPWDPAKPDVVREAYLDSFSVGDDHRTDPELIKLIEEFGSEWASGSHATLEIVEIPDGVDWQIDDYDGYETIHERHRSW